MMTIREELREEQKSQGERRKANLMTAKDKLFFLIIIALFVIGLLVLFLPGISAEDRKSTLDMIVVGFFAVLRSEPLPQAYPPPSTDINAARVQTLNVEGVTEGRGTGTKELNPADAPQTKKAGD